MRFPPDNVFRRSVRRILGGDRVNNGDEPSPPSSASGTSERSEASSSPRSSTSTSSSPSSSSPSTPMSTSPSSAMQIPTAALFFSKLILLIPLDGVTWRRNRVGGTAEANFADTDDGEKTGGRRSVSFRLLSVSTFLSVVLALVVPTVCVVLVATSWVQERACAALFLEKTVAHLDALDNLTWAIMTGFFVTYTCALRTGHLLRAGRLADVFNSLLALDLDIRPVVSRYERLFMWALLAGPFLLQGVVICVFALISFLKMWGKVNDHVGREPGEESCPIVSLFVRMATIGILQLGSVFSGSLFSLFCYVVKILYEANYERARDILERCTRATITAEANGSCCGAGSSACCCGFNSPSPDELITTPGNESQAPRPEKYLPANIQMLTMRPSFRMSRSGSVEDGHGGTKRAKGKASKGQSAIESDDLDEGISVEGSREDIRRRASSGANRAELLEKFGCQLEHIRQTSVKLSGICNKVCDAFHPMLITKFITHMSLLTVLVYQFIVALRHKKLVTAAVAVVSGLHALSEIILLPISAGWVTEQVARSLRILSYYSVNSLPPCIYRQVTIMVGMHLPKGRLELTLSNYSVLNRTTTMAVLGAIAVYSVVLLQVNIKELMGPRSK